ncbi:hypothetical protein AB1Y20_006934 [Prymnesium parvum]|uniref:DNA-directed DNA polymerase family A palm domain-containing protein n=1 Tax=Prymnesium parvum TaxID=97485 RepID=A0AB34IZF4_PRYPA
MLRLMALVALCRPAGALVRLCRPSNRIHTLRDASAIYRRACPHRIAAPLCTAHAAPPPHAQEPPPSHPAKSKGARRPGVAHLVESVRSAHAALAALQSLPPSTMHACDTEVSGLDLSKSPLGQGRVICMSVYSGAEVDYGSGPGVPLWVDTTDLEVLEVFKPWLEDEAVLKVWHNYGFDRHVLYNHGVDVRGFGGDTLHMARLWDASRKAGYSLEALTEELLEQKKEPMKELFGTPVLKKDGSAGKKLELAPVDKLQSSPMTRKAWIDYSVYDAKSTWLLHDRLRSELEQMEWMEGRSQYEYYWRYWRPFGELLTDMEREGIRVDVQERLPRAQIAAQASRSVKELRFRRWAASYCADAWYMNVGSATQLQTFFFGGTRSAKRGGDGAVLPLQRVFKLPREEYEELHAARHAVDVESLAYGVHAASEANAASPPRDGAKPRRHVEFTLKSLELRHSKVTKTTGFPAVDSAALRELAGEPYDEPPVYGSAYAAFGGGEAGARACRAIDDLSSVSAIDTMLSNFILPLQQNADARSRVHCSLNLNTETGRLSSRAPNLQNQPALEKDAYKIRAAFTAEEGNLLVVADYGQLELRLLAHISACRSMIDAFEKGGCFHSRTAMGMFAHVREAVDKGECLLEWDYSKGKPTAPLLKDRFGSERRRAKTLNFSIAYGKTPHGLSKDWGVSIDEAKQMLLAWYADRPEVRQWQEETIAKAHAYGHTRTLMGRYRKLNGINGPPQIRGHLERAAINTPIQGGAADIMTLAMLKLRRSPKLKQLGYRLLLQIHDEVILEGPAEAAQEAMAETVECMRNPFDEALPGLLVELAVDAKVAFTWYDAK